MILNTLLTWIGKTDLDAAAGVAKAGFGPIGQAVTNRTYDQVHLISDFKKSNVSAFKKWLGEKTAAQIEIHYKSLSSPIDFGDIYKAATDVIKDLQEQNGTNLSLTYHLSPGTPAMAAVWIILSKTRFPAGLIESSQQFGVRTVSIPFDISAEFIPDLLRKPDEELEKRSTEKPDENPEFSDILHRSAVMNSVVRQAQKVSFRNIPVLLEGESGTGKELIARAIHRSNPRATNPFIAVNCGAIPPELVESELFGHKRGSFSGAISDRIGYFEQANHGTLFLDEIGELPKEAQVKLLRAVQESEITRVGETVPKAIDARIIAATNRDLLAEVIRGNFREDLFYRIAVMVIKIPPLRAREGDLSLLMDALLDKVNKESTNEPGHKNKKLSASAKNLMLQYSWPGNVRELLNTLRRAVVWSEEEVIGLDTMKGAILSLPTRDLQETILNRSIESGIALEGLLDHVAKHYLVRALQLTHGNKSKAAELLGFSNYQTLTNWMKRHGITG
jgi:transcriptional regulator with PAS, ATPase and Fis domain